MRPKSTYERHCEVLEVVPGTPMPEIERSFRELIKVWHPDRFLDNPALQIRATRKTSELTRSFQWIRKHDEFLRMRREATISSPEQILSLLRRSLAQYVERHPQTSSEVIERAVRAFQAEVVQQRTTPRSVETPRVLTRFSWRGLKDSIVTHRKQIAFWGTMLILFILFGAR